MLLIELFDNSNENAETVRRSQIVDKTAMSIATFLRKHPTQIPAVEKIFGVKLPTKKKGLNTNKDGSVVYESLTESVILGDLYGVPRDLLVEGRPDINAVILDFYELHELDLLDEGVFDNVKKAAKGAVKGAKGVAKGGKATYELAKKLNTHINKAAKLLGDTKPVEDFDSKFNDLLNRYKEKAGDDSTILQSLKTLGDIGKNHPKKSSFIIGAVTGLTSAFGTPLVGIPLGVALFTTLGIAQGEKASVAFAKALKKAGISAVAGVVAGGAVDMLKSSGISLSDIIGEPVVYGDAGDKFKIMRIDTQLGDSNNGASYKGDMMIPNTDVDNVMSMAKAIKSGDADYGLTKRYMDTLAVHFHKQETYFQISGINDKIAEKLANNSAIDAIAKGIAAATGGGASAVKAIKAGFGTPQRKSGVQSKNARGTGKTQATDPRYQAAVDKIQAYANKLRPEEKTRVGNGIAKLLQ